MKEYPDYKYRPRKKLKSSPGCPSGPIPSPKQPKVLLASSTKYSTHIKMEEQSRPGCLKPRFGVRPGRMVQNNNINMTGTNTILHQKTVMTAGVQVLTFL